MAGRDLNVEVGGVQRGDGNRGADSVNLFPF